MGDLLCKIYSELNHCLIELTITRQKKSEKVINKENLLAIVYICKRFNKLLLYVLVIKSNIVSSGQIFKDINDLVFAKSMENCVTHLV